MKIFFVIKILLVNINIFCFFLFGFLVFDKFLKYKNMKENIGKNKMCGEEVGLFVISYFILYDKCLVLGVLNDRKC